MNTENAKKQHEIQPNEVIFINLAGHRLAFEKAFAEEFEEITHAPLELLAEVYLAGEFRGKDIDEVFRTYSEEHIKQVILDAAEQEIDLYSGRL